MATPYSTSTRFPRVTIEFCTQCKWNLRAAYFAQELLSTFSNDLGEVSLQPSGSGTFIVTLFSGHVGEDGQVEGVKRYLLWDRKEEGGFPETKELKRRVRDIIDPNRNLGHVDRKKTQSTDQIPTATPAPAPASFSEENKAEGQGKEKENGEGKGREKEVEEVNSRGMIVIGGGSGGGMGEGGGFCKIGEDGCEDCV